MISLRNGVNTPTVTEGLLELGHCRVNVVVASIAGVSSLPLKATAPISGTFGLSSCKVQPFITLSQDQVHVEVFLGMTKIFGSASILQTPLMEDPPSSSAQKSLIIGGSGAETVICVVDCAGTAVPRSTRTLAV